MKQKSVDKIEKAVRYYNLIQKSRKKKEKLKELYFGERLTEVFFSMDFNEVLYLEQNYRGKLK